MTSCSVGSPKIVYTLRKYRIRAIERYLLRLLEVFKTYLKPTVLEF